jgi:hypothetical protein
MTGYSGGHLYVEEPVVIDRDLITANSVNPVEFAAEIFRRLDLYEPHVLASWVKLFADQDPNGYYELMEA